MADVKIELRRDLSAAIAAMVTDHVDKIAADVVDSAQRKAPGTKRWVGVADFETRPEHLVAQQLLPKQMPANLRWAVRSIDWDIEHYGVGAWTWMLEPLDLSSGLGPDGANIHDCRCSTVVDPFGISRKIRASEAIATSRGARAVVSVTAFGVIESHEGDIYPAPARPAQGTRFMTKAAMEVAARYAAA